MEFDTVFSLSLRDERLTKYSYAFFIYFSYIGRKVSLEISYSSFSAQFAQVAHDVTCPHGSFPEQFFFISMTFKRLLVNKED